MHTGFRADDPMRIALLGCGWVAAMHARAARECGQELAGVANHRLGSAQVFARELEIRDRTYASAGVLA